MVTRAPAREEVHPVVSAGQARALAPGHPIATPVEGDLMMSIGVMRLEEINVPEESEATSEECVLNTLTGSECRMVPTTEGTSG